MSKALKRQGSIFTHHHAQSHSVTSLNSVSTASLHSSSPSASLISLPKSTAPSMQTGESVPVTPPGLSSHIRGRSSAEKPRPLYLRLNTVPVSPTDNRFPSSLPPTPTSRASISHFPPSPSSPSFFTTPDIAEVRRKRMAKLARTLGENVPTELVFASEASPARPAADETRRKRRSMSVSHAYSKDAPFVHRKASSSRPKQDWVGEWNRGDIREVQKELRNLKAR
ncbi:hypothetical protein F5I97DRAFT_1898067 [Phlebopus sp. FC_14]|nr:hypothetical protein F5I97DRAFT_1898067 [Phlebopus sp. FC_14]